MTFAPNNTLSPFLQTYQFYVTDPEQQLVTFTQAFTDVANYVNIREIGRYETVEILTGQQFTDVGNNNRKNYTFRKIFYFGPILAGATLTIAHGITFVEFSHIYGTCVTDGPLYRPIPYSSVTAVNQQIELFCDLVNINIINGAAAPNIVGGIIILEYLKT